MVWLQASWNWWRALAQIEKSVQEKVMSHFSIWPEKWPNGKVAKWKSGKTKKWFQTFELVACSWQDRKVTPGSNSKMASIAVR